LKKGGENKRLAATNNTVQAHPLGKTSINHKEEK
jgi:hypothetical protein